MYSLEQRSEGDETPHGWHIHWRVEFDTYSSKSIYIQQIYQCFQKYVGDQAAIDMKPWNDNQPKYIRGEKISDKMGRVEKDKILRTKFLIPPFITY